MSTPPTSPTPPEIDRPDAHWRAQLDPLAYEVTRRGATERAFTGRYWDHFEPGRYACICCGTPLFDAASKFDAGCGWPSYTDALAAGLVERVIDRSHGMVRVEVRCKRCAAHLGHVFPDGPAPTGERYCINSAALAFEPAAKP